MSAAPLHSRTPPPDVFRPRLALRRRLGAAFAAFCLLLTLGALAVLFVLLAQVLREGWPPQAAAGMSSAARWRARVSAFTINAQPSISTC